MRRLRMDMLFAECYGMLRELHNEWGVVLDVHRLVFFKQKTAYEILSGLVGSEMCLRDGAEPGA